MEEFRSPKNFLYLFDIKGKLLLAIPYLEEGLGHEERVSLAHKYVDSFNHYCCRGRKEACMLADANPLSYYNPVVEIKNRRDAWQELKSDNTLEFN